VCTVAEVIDGTVITVAMESAIFQTKFVLVVDSFSQKMNPSPTKPEEERPVAMKYVNTTVENGKTKFT